MERVARDSARTNYHEESGENGPGVVAYQWVHILCDSELCAPRLGEVDQSVDGRVLCGTCDRDRDTCGGDGAETQESGEGRKIESWGNDKWGGEWRREEEHVDFQFVSLHTEAAQANKFFSFTHSIELLVLELYMYFTYKLDKMLTYPFYDVIHECVACASSSSKTPT